MTKIELTKAIAAKANITQAQAAAAYDAFIGSVAEALKAGEKVSLVGFGTFELKEVAAKDGINPKTGEKIKIAASKKPALKFGKAFKDLFN